LENLKVKDYTGDLDTDVKTILERILNRVGGGGLDSSG